jgi:quinol monooxygenase YgiN
MTAINVVRFRVKPGMEKVFLDAHRDGKADWPGLVRGLIVETGERTYVLLGEWRDMDAIGAARKSMIGTLDTFRHALEDLGPGLGVTDAVSGDAVLALK